MNLGEGTVAPYETTTVYPALGYILFRQKEALCFS